MRKISEFFMVCKDCAAPDRHPGCHDTCEYYRKEREKYEDAKKQEEREKKQRTYVSNGRTYCRSVSTMYVIDDLIKEYENEE